jgi:hypothetical protein
MMSPSRIRPIAPPAAASGLMWPSDRPEDPPENRPSVISAHLGPSQTALEVGGRVQHLLHARAALGALVAHDDDVAGDDLPAEDHLDGLVLALGDLRRDREGPLMLGDAGRLDDAAVHGEVAVQDARPPSTV